MALQVAYVDKEELACERFQRYFSEYHRVYTYNNPDQLFRALREQVFHVVVAQTELRQLTGLEVLQRIEKTAPQTLKILLTDRLPGKSLEASGYLLLQNHLSRRGVERLCQFIEKLLLERHTPEANGKNNKLPDIVYASDEMHRQLSFARRIADLDDPVVITGDTGTGKDLLAKYIHYSGHRQDHHLQVVNCAAINETLFESEFFGHVKGAFTGAESNAQGHFRQAHQGTLVLDEIGELPAEQQAKLLRAIDNKEAYPVGSPEVVHFNTRVIALTNRNIHEDIRSGRFRSDLYHRLNTFQIHLKPLRERRDDILPLVDHYLKNSWYSILPDWQRNISDEARHLLEILDYTGNVRDLRNVVSQLLVGKSTHNPMITRQDVELLFTGGIMLRGDGGDEHPEQLGEYLERMERKKILAAFGRNEKNVSKTARELGLTRQNLRRRMSRLGIEVDV